MFFKGWETAEEYLPGYLMRKWKTEKANQKYDGWFSDNIKAIERVLPPSVAMKDIYTTLGSPLSKTSFTKGKVRTLVGVNCLQL
jgi:N12 class adenine-specific DNA methylase